MIRFEIIIQCDCYNEHVARNSSGSANVILPLVVLRNTLQFVHLALERRQWFPPRLFCVSVGVRRLEINIHPFLIECGLGVAPHTMQPQNDSTL